MKWLLVVLLIPSWLIGCCPHRDITIEGSAQSGVLIYDPNNDTLYWFDVTGRNTTKKWKHWNNHDD